jgi:hypothetical protein
MFKRLPLLRRPDDGGAGGAQGAGAGTPPPPPAGGAAPPPPPPGIAWLPGADESAVGYVHNKGWANPNDAVTGYRNLETLLGADRAGRTIVLPKDDQDITTRETMLSKLGWSKDVAAYKLPVPEGADPKFAADMAGLFSKHGVPIANAQALTADWNAYQGAQAKVAADADAAAGVAADAQLEKDWGAERSARTELARRAAVGLGLDAAALDALQKGPGYVGVMKALAKVGDMMKEHGAAGMDVNPGSFGMTPEGAKVRKTELFADADWRARAMKEGSAEANELKRLSGIIASTAQS